MYKPYLSKVPHVKQVKSLKQLALLHTERITAGSQKSPDVLQAEKLCGTDKKTILCEKFELVNIYPVVRLTKLTCVSSFVK